MAKTASQECRACTSTPAVAAAKAAAAVSAAQWVSEEDEEDEEVEVAAGRWPAGGAPLLLLLAWPWAATWSTQSRGMGEQGERYGRTNAGRGRGGDLVDVVTDAVHGAGRDESGGGGVCGVARQRGAEGLGGQHVHVARRLLLQRVASAQLVVLVQQLQRLGVPLG